MDLREIKFYKGRTILDITEKDALYCIKSPTETAFKLYVTDIDGNIVSLASVNSTISLTSSDNSISITGTAVKDLKISNSLKTLILNSIQPGSNISELNNDSGYITITDLPIFNPSDYDLNDFNNSSLDPFVRQSELTPSSTNLGYTPASNQGTVTSDTGSDAILPLATTTDAGLLSPTEKSKLAGIEDGAEVNNISDTDANDLTDGNETTLHHHDSRYYTETESDNKFVPYTGATQDVDLGERQLKAGQLELDQTPTGTFGVGKIRWNDTAGTAEIKLKGDNVTLQIGQELVKRVVNKTATNINLLESNYQVVKIVSATGQRLSVDLAQANTSLNYGTTLGVVTENINNNQEGFITYSGEVNLINTTGSLQGETWNDGDILYLSPTVPGALTKIKPTAPYHVVIVGYVEYAHAVNGKIFVKIDSGYQLDDLHDVKTTSPQNNDVLMYNNSIWENKNPFDYFDAKPIVYQKHVNMPVWGSPTVNNVEGVAFVAGNTARTWADTNIVTRTQRQGVISITTGNAAQIRQTITYLSQIDGFNVVSGFNMAENATDTAIRFFIGLSTTTLFSNVEPNTLLNCIGFCRLSTSNNIHLVHNDNAGIGTTLDLGSNFPANTISTDKYLVYWKTVSTGIYIKIERVGTAFTYETIVTSDIPSTTTALNFGAYIVDMSGASVSTGFDWYGTHIQV